MAEILLAVGILTAFYASADSPGTPSDNVDACSTHTDCCQTGNKSAQPVFADNYYYYEGKKVNITIDKQKICVMTPKVNGNITPIPGRLPCSVSVFKTLNDDDYDIKIFKSSLPDIPIINMTQLFSSVVGSMVFPCYLDENGRDLCPTNLISVCLKSTDDHYLLSNAIKNYSLKIEEHFDDMPLWYYLSLTSDSGIDLANLLYETGGFKSAAPVFWVDGLHAVSFCNNRTPFLSQ